MRKRLNFGIITTLVATVLVIVFLIGFAVFHIAESNNIKSDLDALMKNKYGLKVVSSETGSVYFSSTKKAKLNYTVTNEVKSVKSVDYYSNSYYVEVEKKNGTWEVVFTNIDIVTDFTETEVDS